jgi:hypothetical protein
VIVEPQVQRPALLGVFGEWRQGAMREQERRGSLAEMLASTGVADHRVVVA